ncbi:MAG: hypothetical protein D6722_16665 [Bacteroidetes bacterium]|nr:MAG: hypothetical protein D6722_16665 [Bacteroidota bacterium]
MASSGWAQPDDAHALQDRQLSLALSQQQAVLGWPPPLHQGRVFSPYLPSIIGNPWLDSLWQSGTVQWEDQTYGPVLLRYNTHQDQLLFRPHLQAAIKLDDSLVQAFWLGERYFVMAYGPYLTEEAPAPLRTGYHERPYSSDSLRLMVKYRKQLFSYHRSNTIEQSFRPWMRMYLETPAGYHSIRTRSHLRQAFPQYRSQLRRLYRAEQIRRGKLTVDQCVRILQVIDSLSAAQ